MVGTKAYMGSDKINALKLNLKMFCVDEVMCLGELRAGNCVSVNEVTTSN
jgi:hypothetical protein